VSRQDLLPARPASQCLPLSSCCLAGLPVHCHQGSLSRFITPTGLGCATHAPTCDPVHLTTAASRSAAVHHLQPGPRAELWLCTDRGPALPLTAQGGVQQPASFCQLWRGNALLGKRGTACLTIGCLARLQVICCFPTVLLVMFVQLQRLAAGRHRHQGTAGTTRAQPIVKPLTHHSSASLQVDYVRVYQDPAAFNVGCSPAAYPTEQYIAW